MNHAVLQKVPLLQTMLYINQFSSHVTGKAYKTYHQVNCKSSNIIYLMDCSKCRKQYVGKAQTAFNLKLNNHRKGVRRTDAIRADRHFNSPDHDFDRNTKRTCEANPAGKNSSFIFTVCVKSVPLYHFKLA